VSKKKEVVPPRMSSTSPLIISVLDELAQRPLVDESVKRLVGELRSALAGSVLPADAPFLTVIVRTQGNRLETLRDSLLCLAGQTNQDFDVVLVVHNGAADDIVGVRNLVEAQMRSFRDRISVVEVTGGSRATPLNRALDHVRGRYIAVFDDDDLLFGNWVEAFATGATEAPGMLLRGLVAVQRAQVEPWSHRSQGYRATSWPEVPYQKDFEPLEHLVVNQSPFMSIAFPRELFALYGVRFDEELDVCEDWDVILQGSFLLGVHDVHELTAIYRMWTGTTTSYTTHSQEAWARSEARVVSRLNSWPLILPPGAADQLRYFATRDDAEHAYAFMFKEGKLRAPFRVGVAVIAPFLRLAVWGRARAKKVARRILRR
jgi:hypothetical protein